MPGSPRPYAPAAAGCPSPGRTGRNSSTAPAYGAKHRHVAGKVPAVQAVQPVVKLPQLLQRRCRASRRLPQQGRVRHQSTAYHDGVVGKGLPHLPQVTDGGDVPVVAQRQRCVLCRPAEHLPVCCPLVELRPHPWMHRQAADRVCLQQGPARRPLLRPSPIRYGS